MDTIFAQSTAKGKAGVAIIRVSGPKSIDIIYNLTQRKVFDPNKMYVCDLSHAGLIIDKAMAVYFKAPNSFTGEDIVEFHVHGSIAIVRILTEILLKMDIRIAEPGEFSKRAFLNGKIDLTAAEGLADLIDSETSAQHRQAIRHMSGELEMLCESWREMLVKSMSLIEAYIDFPEEDIPESVMVSTQNLIEKLKFSLEEKLNDKRRGERLRSGITMAVLGEPNVGKSSLMNFLSQRDVSIVSDIAGTTRDVIETHLDIGGYPIILIDTAGIREVTEDLIEREGMNRAC
jgi:tRNA modification GTPase